ncbi:hypothetical protein [Nonomuraea recticatena]|uniref:Uncharacterized protein n=1 Tax=Nonomuraea recticatena TaxID=46178 RepID=A0ABP6FTN3_9ACTN
MSGLYDDSARYGPAFAAEAPTVVTEPDDGGIFDDGAVYGPIRQQALTAPPGAPVTGHRARRRGGCGRRQRSGTPA